MDTEFQALTAFASYNSPSIAGRSIAMTESTMEKLIMKLCFGDENGNNDVICFVDQFLLGVNKFKGLLCGRIAESPDQGAVNTNPDAVLPVPQFLHCQGSINVFVGEGSIEKRLLFQKLLSNEVPITGRTMLSCKAKDGTKGLTTKLSDCLSGSAKKRQMPQESTTIDMSVADEANKDQDEDENIMAQAVQFFHS